MIERTRKRIVGTRGARSIYVREPVENKSAASRAAAYTEQRHAADSSQAGQINRKSSSQKRFRNFYALGDGALLK